MKAFTTLTSKVAPLNLKDIDTDMIIPAQYLTGTGSSGYGEHLFSRLKENDPEFVTNQEKYKDSEILIAGDNFGCGSSREHAVWALSGAGFRIVIAPSFADIFYSNSAKNGLLLITLNEDLCNQVIEKATNTNFSISVNLAKQEIDLGEFGIKKFDYDPFRKTCLLKGQDDKDYILSKTDKIDQWQATRQKHTFYSPLYIRYLHDYCWVGYVFL